MRKVLSVPAVLTLVAATAAHAAVTVTPILPTTYQADETGFGLRGVVAQQVCSQSQPCQPPAISGVGDFNNGVVDYPNGNAFSSLAYSAFKTLEVRLSASGQFGATGDARYMSYTFPTLNGTAQISPSTNNAIINSHWTYDITDGFTIRINGHVSADGAVGDQAAATLNNYAANANLYFLDPAGSILSQLRSGTFVPAVSQSYVLGSISFSGANGPTPGTSNETVTAGASGLNAVIGSDLQNTNETSVGVGHVTSGPFKTVSGDLGLILTVPHSLAAALLQDDAVFQLTTALSPVQASGGTPDYFAAPNDLFTPSTASLLVTPSLDITSMEVLDSAGNVVPFFTFTTADGNTYSSPSLRQPPTPTPEPSSFYLFFSGLLLLGALGRPWWFGEGS
jgi:hypothetical protein